LLLVSLMRKSAGELQWEKRKFERIDASQILKKSRRFDLIFKFLYVKHIDSVHADFYERLYLLSIKHFNAFSEIDPPKSSEHDFLDAFRSLLASINANGFDESSGELTITSDGDLYAGAHRLAVSAHQGLNVRMGIIDLQSPYDYEYFLKRQLPRWAADLAALEFVKLSKFAFVATVHSCVPEYKIDEVEKIIKNTCKVYYKKEIFLDFNSYVNLKKVSYLGDSWLGDVEHGFAGAIKHAKESFGIHPLRVYVLICDSESLLVPMKALIRDECGLGNYSIHITDNHNESIRLAELLLQETSLSILKIPYESDDYCKDSRIIAEFKSYLRANSKSLSDYCVVGSHPLEVLRLRKARDLDFVTADDIQDDPPPRVDNHGCEDDLYFGGTINQIVDPRCHFFYSGVKFLSLGSLIYYKSRRLEVPKDASDIALILGGVSFMPSSFADGAVFSNGGNVFITALKKYVPASIKQFLKKFFASSP